MGFCRGLGRGRGREGDMGVGKAEATRKRNGNMESLPTKWSFSHLKKRNGLFWMGGFFLRPEFIDWDDDGP